MDCLQLPCIREEEEEEAVSWTQRFLTRKFWLKNRSLFMTNKFKRKCLQKFDVYVNRKKNDTGRPRLTSSNRAAFLSAVHAKNDTTNPFGKNLASQQKTTKLYFSSQVKKQLKLLAVSFKPLRCRLRNDNLVKCHVWKFCKDLFLNLRVILSVNQIVLNGNRTYLMVSSLILLRSLRVYILKQLFFLVE